MAPAKVAGSQLMMTCITMITKLMPLCIAVLVHMDYTNFTRNVVYNPDMWCSYGTSRFAVPFPSLSQAIATHHHEGDALMQTLWFAAAIWGFSLPASLIKVVHEVVANDSQCTHSLMIWCANMVAVLWILCVFGNAAIPASISQFCIPQAELPQDMPSWHETAMNTLMLGPVAGSVMGVWVLRDWPPQSHSSTQLLDKSVFVAMICFVVSMVLALVLFVAFFQFNSNASNELSELCAGNGVHLDELLSRLGTTAAYAIYFEDASLRCLITISGLIGILNVLLMTPYLNSLDILDMMPDYAIGSIAFGVLAGVVGLWVLPATSYLPFSDFAALTPVVNASVDPSQGWYCPDPDLVSARSSFLGIDCSRFFLILGVAFLVEFYGLRDRLRQRALSLHRPLLCA